MDIEERKGKMTASLQENVAYMNGRLAVDASFDLVYRVIRIGEREAFILLTASVRTS